MRFFDCNAFFGLPARRPVAPVASPDELLAEMDRAGVDRALVWHIAQHDVAPQTGNEMLAEAIEASRTAGWLLGVCCRTRRTSSRRPRSSSGG